MEGSAAQPTTFASRGELPSVSEDEASEVLQGDFGPAFLAGAEGRVFVTSERLFFCAQIKRSLDETPPDPPGAAPSEESAPSATEAALELRLFFPLVAWTSTERSKKAAKARVSFLDPTCTSTAVASAVLDFKARREVLDACCDALQRAAAAARARRLKDENAAVQTDLSLLKAHTLALDPAALARLLKLPSETPLSFAAALAEHQRLVQRQLETLEGQALLSATKPDAGEEAPQSAENVLAGSQRPKASLKKRKGAGASSEASGAEVSAKKARLDLAELRQAQAKEEEEEEKELRSRLLETQPALRTLYECLVRNAQEGESPSSSGPFVSEADFWKLEGAALLPLKSQTAPERVDAFFLTRPPVFECAADRSGGAAGGGQGDSQSASTKPSFSVDCSPAMLEQLRREDPVVRKAYTALVQSGVSFQALPSAEVFRLPGVERHLLSDEDFRVAGRGLVDGLSSLAGDLSQSRPSAETHQQGAASSGSGRSGSVPPPSLGERFNRHSQRLLLQQLLAPVAAKAATALETELPEQVRLLVDLEMQMRNKAQQNQAKPQRPPAFKATSSAQQGELSFSELRLLSPCASEISPSPCVARSASGSAVAALCSAGVRLLPAELPLFEGLRLEELESAAPPKVETLSVSRRQLYAAGARSQEAESEQQRQSEASSEGNSEEEARLAKEAVERWLALREAEEQKLREEKQPRPISPVVWETGRFMFIQNTKTCQNQKNAQIAQLEYERPIVESVREEQAKVSALLHHFYATTLPEEKKRSKLLTAMTALGAELERLRERSAGEAGAARKALTAPLLEQLAAARRLSKQLEALLQRMRQKRADHQLKQQLSQTAAAKPKDSSTATAAGAVG